MSLTKKQQTVLDFIQRYVDQQQVSPLIREVQAGCQIVSYKSALDRLNALERKGLIRRTPNKHRGIKLLRRLEVQPLNAPTVKEQPPVSEGSNEPTGVVA